MFFVVIIIIIITSYTNTENICFFRRFIYFIFKTSVIIRPSIYTVP